MRYAAQHTAPADSSYILAFAVITVITLLGFGIYKMHINKRVASKALEVKHSRTPSHFSGACASASLLRYLELYKSAGRSQPSLPSLPVRAAW